MKFVREREEKLKSETTQRRYAPTLAGFARDCDRVCSGMGGGFGRNTQP